MATTLQRDDSTGEQILINIPVEAGLDAVMNLENM
jgi:hypothetical protein